MLFRSPPESLPPWRCLLPRNPMSLPALTWITNASAQSWKSCCSSATPAKLPVSGNACAANCHRRMTLLYILVYTSKPNKLSKLCASSTMPAFPVISACGQGRCLPVESNKCAGCAKPVQDAPTQAMTAAQSSRLRVFCASTVFKAEIGHCVV